MFKMWSKNKGSINLYKIDSIYRNELMDDILNLLKLVRNSRILLEDKISGQEKIKNALVNIKKWFIILQCKFV